MVKNFLAASVLLALASASNAAVITASLGGNSNPANFITLSSANVSGGSLLPQGSGTIPNLYAEPLGAVGTWIAAGESGSQINNNNGGVTSVATLSIFTQYLSFLWGSPDGFNALSITTSDAVTTTFTNVGLGVVSTPEGNQAFSQYVNFTTTGTDYITSVSFATDNANNAFEVANVSAVPEPETYALMLAGLGIVGFMARRRKAA